MTVWVKPVPGSRVIPSDKGFGAEKTPAGGAARVMVKKMLPVSEHAECASSRCADTYRTEIQERAE